MTPDRPERRGVRTSAVLLPGGLILFSALALIRLLTAGGAPAALTGRHAVLVSPEKPQPGRPVRVLAAFDADAAKVRIALRGPSGDSKPESLRRGGGPPFWLAAEFGAAPAGTFDVVLIEGREEVTARPSDRPDVAKGWDWASEGLYSAWIEALFADADERSTWPALHEVTRDPRRNL